MFIVHLKVSDVQLGLKAAQKRPRVRKQARKSYGKVVSSSGI
jgi:hypothetical protein